MSNQRPYSITPDPDFPPTSRRTIGECEKELGVKFPDDYKQFLRTHNGGTPSPQQLDIPNTKHAVLLDFLYGILGGTESGDLVYEYQVHKRDLPPGFIPIGHDPGGSPFLLATTGEHRGKVYFWDRTHFFKESSASENTYWLADSFTDLLNSLYEPRRKRR